MSSRPRKTMGFVMQSLSLKRFAKQTDRANATARARRDKKMEVKLMAQKNQEKWENESLTQIEAEQLKSLRAGGKSASRAIQYARDNVSMLNADYFSKLSWFLIKDGKYEEAKALQVCRLVRPEYYTPDVARSMLWQAAKHDDSRFADRIAREVIKNELPGKTKFSLLEHLKVATNMAQAGVVSLHSRTQPYSNLVIASELELSNATTKPHLAVNFLANYKTWLRAFPDKSELIARQKQEPSDGLPVTEALQVTVIPGKKRASARKGGAKHDKDVGQGQAELENGQDAGEAGSKSETNDGGAATAQAADETVSVSEKGTSSDKKADALNNLKERRKQEIGLLCAAARDNIVAKNKKAERSEMENVILKAHNKLIKIFGKSSNATGVFQTLDLLNDIAVNPNYETYENISNALIKSVDFVTSAVSWETLPEAKPEVAFVGRSNVGKSSLVNMLTNRKALAKVAKTPGKTKMYNYFIVNNGREGGTQFYFVDLPGVGFAKAPGQMTERWSAFMAEYFKNRDTLKVVFHLVDSKLGIMKHDRALMRLARSTGIESKYAIILTKVDKLRTRAVSDKVIGSVLEALEEHGLPLTTAVIPTSTPTRIGRDELWRLLYKHLMDGKFPNRAKVHDDGYPAVDKYD